MCEQDKQQPHSYAVNHLQCQSRHSNVFEGKLINVEKVVKMSFVKCDKQMTTWEESCPEISNCLIFYFGRRKQSFCAA